MKLQEFQEVDRPIPNALSGAGASSDSWMK